MTFAFILILNIGQSVTPGLTSEECNAAVRLAPVAVAEFGPGVRLVRAECRRS